VETQTLYEFLKKLDRLNVTIVIDGFPHDPGSIAENVERPDIIVWPSGLLEMMFERGIRFFRREGGKAVYLLPDEVLRGKKIPKNKGIYLVKK